MNKNKLLVYFTIILVSLPSPASAISAHDATNSVDHVVTYCPMRGENRMSQHESPVAKHLGHTSFWDPLAGTTGRCIARMYVRVNKGDEPEFKDVCTRPIKAYQQLEYWGNRRCYVSKGYLP